MEVKKLNGKNCYSTGVKTGYTKLFLWPCGKHEEREHLFEALLPVLQEQNCLLVAFEVEDWNGELSPWEAPAVFGKEGFPGRGRDTLEWLVQDCISHFKKGFQEESGNPALLTGGYSLAGLFALWAFHETGLFRGAASCSGSLWFPGFTEYVKGQKDFAEPIKGQTYFAERGKKRAAVYLSLGSKEAKSRNPALAAIKGRTEELYEYYGGMTGVTAKLEWNPGNHFTEPKERLRKGFTWLLEHTV